MKHYRILRIGSQYYPMAQVGWIFKRWMRIGDYGAFYLTDNMYVGWGSYKQAKDVIDRYHKSMLYGYSAADIVGDFTYSTVKEKEVKQ